MDQTKESSLTMNSDKRKQEATRTERIDALTDRPVLNPRYGGKTLRELVQGMGKRKKKPASQHKI